MRKKIIKTKILEAIAKEYNKIETASDLRKRHITLAEYREIGAVIAECCDRKKAKCFSERAAAFFRENGATIRPFGIGWLVDVA